MPVALAGRLPSTEKGNGNRMSKLSRRVAYAAIAITATAGFVLPAVTASATTGTTTGVFLSSTPALTLAAPNVITSGKAAVLKKCNGTGDCSVIANLRTTETFDLVANTTTVYAGDTIPTGFSMRLHGTNWCVTNRQARVFFEACHGFPSQNWNGTLAANTTVTTGVLTNQKTSLNLTHTAVAPFAPLMVSAQHTHWGNSS